jgi:putative membrane protein insertion efficiency factor
VSIESACAVSPPGRHPGVAARAFLLLIDVYRAALSPLLGGFCRFVPSCSVYAAEAIRRHGARQGLLLAVRRILRCHPFHPGGLDPVP